jgi:hypothetical protein
MNVEGRLSPLDVARTRLAPLQRMCEGFRLAGDLGGVVAAREIRSG